MRVLRTAEPIRPHVTGVKKVTSLWTLNIESAVSRLSYNQWYRAVKIVLALLSGGSDSYKIQ